MSVIVFLGLAAILAACDWRHRTVPRIVCIGGTLLGFTFTPSWWTVAAIGLGTVIGLLAHLPWGDVAVGGMLGAWCGVDGIAAVWILALMVALVVWTCWDEAMIDWPGDWPFTLFLLVPACAIVLAKGE